MTEPAIIMKNMLPVQSGFGDWSAFKIYEDKTQALECHPNAVHRDQIEEGDVISNPILFPVANSEVATAEIVESDESVIVIDNDGVSGFGEFSDILVYESETEARENHPDAIHRNELKTGMYFTEPLICRTEEYGKPSFTRMAGDDGDHDD